MNSGRIARFAAAHPDLVRSRDLLSRVDSKFVVSSLRLESLLDGLVDDYAALKVPTGALATYDSLYFDSPSLQCFHDHRRGRRPRRKVRIRHYRERQLSFLEVKTKRNETVTDKQRLPIAFGQQALGALELAFLREHVGALADQLRPTLAMRYRRLTLIGLHSHERVTIDLELEVHDCPRVGKRWEPGLSAELFHAIDDGDLVHLDKVWLTAGVSHARPVWSADVFYRAELPVADPMEPTVHILGLGVHREL